MDFLNRLLAQLNDLFKSLSPGARMTAGLLLAAVVVSIGYLFNYQSSGADAFLLNGQSFTADELSAMEGAFGKAGLSDYTVDGSRVRITKSRQAAYLGALADGGALPAGFGDHLAQAANSPGPFTSRTQQEEMMKVAKQRELAAVIRTMNGIENAVVHYDVQKSSGLKPTRIATASVSVKPRGNLQLDEKQVPVLRSLVASAIAGLSPENVTIIDINGRAYAGTGGFGGSGGAHDDPYLSMTRAHQALIEANLRDALAYVPGVTVTANVELDREMVKKIIANTIDPKTVPLKVETQENSTSSNSAAGAGGRVGLAAQGPNTPASLPSGGGGSSTEDTRSTSNQINGASTTNTETQMAGLTPKRVSVAIGVPSDYFLKVWQAQNPPAEGEEVKKPDATALATVETTETKRIKDHVVQLIPATSDPTNPVDPATLVTVTAFSHVEMPEAVGPGFMEQALAWLAGSWSTVAMIGLAVFALLMLKSFVGAVPAIAEPQVLSTTIHDEDESPREAAAGASVAASGDAKDPAKPKQRTLQRKLGNGPSLREELIEMVREDPEAAANILRGWIGNTT